MAALAQHDQQARTVIVDRKGLLDKLQTNLTQHCKDYEDAMAGYKTCLRQKVESAFDSAMSSLQAQKVVSLAVIDKMTDEDIPKQRDNYTIVDSISVTMKVPRSYAEEYKSAIDMFTWDVRETVELTFAEFTCFVRDQWDWKKGFDAISVLYKGIGAR